MKAVVVSQFGESDVLQYRDIQDVSAGENEVLIQVDAAGVNFADILARQGKYRRKQPPFIPGNEAAGTIVDVGRDVDRLHVGDRVISFPKTGAYAEFAVADEHLTYLVPDSLSLAEAAAATVAGFTAYHLLAEKGRLQRGETVLIHAASGGVGTTAVQMARILGADMVIGTVGSDEKMSAAYEAGADHVINYRNNDFTPAVLELTKGIGAHLILDSIAGDVTNKSLQCLAHNGRLMIYGKASGQEGWINPDDLQPHNQSIMGFSLSKTRSMLPDLLHHTASQVLGFLEDRKLSMRISSYFPLAEAASAHRLIESRKNSGKLLLLPPRSTIPLSR